MKVTALDIPGMVGALNEVPAELPEGVEIEDLMTGLKSWTNPINRFTVLRLHYSADPRKRSAEWIATTRAGMDTATYLREYELVWEALQGRPVYVDEWSAEFHTSKVPLGWTPALPICRGWDFALNPACVFTQLLTHQRLAIMREAIGIDIDLTRFVDEVNRLSNEWFPGGTFYEFIDPTGLARRDTDGRSCATILSARPLRAKHIIPGVNSIVARHKAVTDFLKANVRGLPCLIVDPSCEYIIKGFNGGYLYLYHHGTLKEKPDKNEFSHPHDALQYICSKILNVTLQVNPAIMKVVEPTYGGRQLTAQEQANNA